MGGRNIFLLQPQPGNPNKVIDLMKLKRDIDQEICDVLLPLHAVTGCDINKCFFRIGKKNNEIC